MTDPTYDWEIDADPEGTNEGEDYYTASDDDGNSDQTADSDYIEDIDDDG